MPRFMTVPFLVKEAPVITTIGTEIAMVVAETLGPTMEHSASRRRRLHDLDNVACILG